MIDTLQPVDVAVPKLTPCATQPLFVIVVTDDGAVTTGEVVSVTITTCVAVLVLPFASVTVHNTFVVPIGNVAGALFVTLATEQLSPVAGVPNATVVLHPVAATLTVSFAVDAVLLTDDGLNIINN